MMSGPFGRVKQWIRPSPTVQADDTESDRLLIARFVRQGDEAAFASLVQRHGPMVLGVCRRVLHDAHDAEDAFQATFLVLVRKAGSLGRPELLGNWLYGVAYRTALRAKREAAARRAHERRAEPMAAADPPEDAVWHDLRPLLDQELAGLADKYRAAVVLCYLEGLTTEEAAQRLGCPKGTVLSRLARARDRLRRRLVRRGLTLSAGLLGAVLSSRASAVLAESLVQSTAQAATAFAAGPSAAAGIVSEPVANLTQGVLKAMFLRKLRIALGLVVGIGVLLSGAILLQYQVRAEPTPDDKAQLQGAWQAVSAERDGRQAPEDYVTSIKPVFTGDRMTMPSRGLGETQQASFKLDPSAKPKAIDITIGGEGKMLGIYELTKDTLKLCLAEPGNERPKEFAGKGKQVLVVLQRAARTGRDEE